MMQRIRLPTDDAAASVFLATGAAPLAFREEQVALAPDETGVYFLYRRERLIYIGVAVQASGIRQEVQRHLEGRYGPGTVASTSFDFEACRDPVVARSEYLRAYRQRNGGRLPPCNEPGRDV